MDDVGSQGQGRLQISVDAIEKIAQHATMEIQGVKMVKGPGFSGKTLREKFAAPHPIQVHINNDVADIEISIVVHYGSKIPEISELIQQNVKNTIQNMTGITVGRVDIVIMGVSAEESIA